MARNNGIDSSEGQYIMFLDSDDWWNPEVVVDGNGECEFEFWTADKDTEYAIYGEGVSADGSIFTVRRTIKIEDR